MKKGIIYFSDSTPDPKILKMCQDQMKKSGLPIVNCSLVPMDFADVNIRLDMKRGWEAYLTQILTALMNSEADIVFFNEHDVLYPMSHYEFTPPTNDHFYYNQNWIKTDWPHTKAVAWDADQVSGLCCDRNLALDFYRKRLSEYDEKNFDRKFEPGSGTEQAVAWRSAEPYVDIRQRKAATKSKWSLADFRDKKTAKNFREAQLPEWVKGTLGIK
jgi:hypothetical protein